MRKIANGQNAENFVRNVPHFTRWLFSAFRIPHSAEDGVYKGRWQLICTYMCTRLCVSLYLRVCIMYGGRHMHAVYIGIYIGLLHPQHSYKTSKIVGVAAVCNEYA